MHLTWRDDKVVAHKTGEDSKVLTTCTDGLKNVNEHKVCEYSCKIKHKVLRVGKILHFLVPGC